MKPNQFNSIQLKSPNRNVFDMSYDNKLSMKMGRLVPVHVQEIIPGDKITMNTQSLIRLAPMVAPVMHLIDVYTHSFFIPNRLVWDGWEDFITNPASERVFPYVQMPNNVDISTIPDYMGIPTGAGTQGLRVSALPFAMMNLIWNEYYRDQNLQPDLKYCDLVDGANSNDLDVSGVFGVPYLRAWEHDYFTAALPWPQKGPEATLPLGTTADINFLPDADNTIIQTQLGNDLPNSEMYTKQNIGSEGYIHPEGDDGTVLNINNAHQLQVDLSTATAASINDLRRAFKLQEWLELAARGGTRYTEVILSFFGVRSSDARLQRPEYLGGGKSPVVISEVLQSSESNNTPQGNLAGRGISSGSSHTFKRSFEEHGYIITIMSVRPRTAYSQGLHKSWFKFDMFDYFWPQFAHIGEQEVRNKEVYANMLDATNGGNEGVFGYVPRYAEYRYNDSKVHGDFRETLEYWHMGRKFTTRPVLNAEFIECLPTDRIFAVQDLPDDGSETGQPVRSWDTLYCHLFHSITAVRPIPKWGSPTM